VGQSQARRLLPNALYVHRSALDSLEPLLRVYEGCARAYLGKIDGAILIKLHQHCGKVSYLVYPDFETDPHPALVRSVKLSLRTREIECFDYAGSANPPILHRKETFLGRRRWIVDRLCRSPSRACSKHNGATVWPNRRHRVAAAGSRAMRFATDLTVGFFQGRPIRRSKWTSA
jgi:hypothetical protein